jgi:rubrerythrin
MTDVQEKTLKALEKGIKMEIDGKEFYLKASEQTGNELGRKLLQSLAAEEDIHRKVFEEIYENMRKKQGWPRKEFKADGGMALRTVFADAIDDLGSDVKTMPEEIDAVKKAMDMENETYDFYKKQAKTASYDAEKNFYEALAVQEEEHHRLLQDYYEFLKDPASYFVMKEHPSLDGG